MEIEALSEADKEWLTELLQEHGALTGSSQAKRILSTPALLSLFVKIMPNDYRRVLAIAESKLQIEVA